MTYVQSIHNLFTQEEKIELFEKDKKVETLPIHINKNGFTYIQLLRGNKSCIYEQRVSRKSIAFEVFLINIKPKRKIKDKIIEAKEWFPPNEVFGKWAWTYRTLEEAKKKFKQLESND